MSYTGFSTPSIAIINQIQTLLKERYKEGFPVIKEIIQNANDGGASTLHIALVQNVNRDISHPLLTRPALVFVNDGDFSDSDERAILWFGADLNAADTSKVGKFGLGQKSIFHFCEAFFYLAQSSTGRNYGAFVNPWAKQVAMNSSWQDPQRQDWQGLSVADRDHLESYLRGQGLIQDNRQFFALWIPLRQESDRKRCILPNVYPNVDAISSHLSANLDVKVATLLPMLRSLNTVSYWIDSKGILEKKFTVSQQPNSESSDRDFLKLNPNTVRPFYGSIDRDDDQNFVRYLGREIKLEDDLVRTIHDSPNWPQRLTEDSEGNPQNTADKPDSHCAALVSRSRKPLDRTGKLVIQWAVFLPVADDERDIAEFESIEIKSEWDYTFLLHGYFFLDSGRRYIEFLKEIRDDDTQEADSPIAKQWNQFLVAKGTLPLVLSALWSFIKSERSAISEAEISEAEISLICSAIAKSKLYQSQTFRSGLCLNSAIVYRISPSGNAWHLVSREECQSKSMRYFPSISSKQIWGIKLLHLSKYAENYILVDQNKSNLLKSNLLSSWQSHEISQLIDHRFDLSSISDPQSIFNLIVSILELVSDKENLISSINQDAKFIQVRLVTKNISTDYSYLSIRDLENAEQERRIFKEPVYSSQNWATALAEAVIDKQIFLVEQRIARLLCGERIKECDRTSCLDFLRQKPELSNLNNRQNLLRRLIQL